MEYTDPVIGLVIPVIKEKYIENTIKLILNTNNRPDLILLIVNDGNQQMIDFLSQKKWPPNVKFLNLRQNRRFAGVNNVGWHYLIENYPNIKYLGSINDDTIPYNRWLDALINSLKSKPRIALASPVLEIKGKFGIKKTYGLLKFKDEGGMMETVKIKMKEDTNAPIFLAYCFIARRDVLEEIGFFDEQYRNCADDLDLSLKLAEKKWQIIISKKSRVFHYGGHSNYRPGVNDNVDFSLNYLRKKWGSNLSRYNRIDFDTEKDTVFSTWN